MVRVTPPSSGPPDGPGGGVGSGTDSSNGSDIDQIGPLSFGLRMTLGEFGVPWPSVSAEYSAGRLAGLELASALGIRPARRALARERQSLLRRCFPAIDPAGLIGADERGGD